MIDLPIPGITTILAILGWFVLIFISSFYVLWILFLAIMNLKRVRDADQLPKQALILGTPVLFLGLAVDLFCNILLTVVLFEMPRESTVTARLKRHNKATGGYRKWVASIFEPILDPFDPSGDHI